MNKSIEDTIAKYLSLAKEQFSDIVCAYLFGSFARGNANDDSDIDLALIIRNLDDLSDLRYKFN